MDLIKGMPLKNFVEKAPPTRQTLEIMEKVAKAVNYAHEQGVVHRDLKTSNIMVDSLGEPTVMDFGLAKLQKESTKLSTKGIILGTLCYMPPEQANGEIDKVDARSDIYSLGVILYELLTGQLPFIGDSHLKIMLKINQQEPVAPSKIKPNIPKFLEAVCLKSMSKQREDRYQSALELANKINEFLRKKDISKRIKTSTRSSRLKAKKRKKIWPMAVAITIILLPLFFFIRKNSKPEKVVNKIAKSKKHKASEKKKVEKKFSRYYKIVTRDKPIGYWRLGEILDTKAKNEVNNRYNGVYKNGVQLGEPGITTKNTAAYFDGYDDFITIKSSFLPRKTFSVEIWVKYHKFFKRGKIIGSSNSEKGWYIGNYKKRLTFNLATKDDDSGEEFSGVFFPVKLQKWYHVVGVYNGENMRLYVNGKSNFAIPKIGDVFYRTNIPLDIGISRDTDKFFAYKGLIDEIALYNYALSAKQIQDHFKSASLDKADSQKISFFTKKAQRQLLFSSPVGEGEKAPLHSHDDKYHFRFSLPSTYKKLNKVQIAIVHRAKQSISLEIKVNNSVLKRTVKNSLYESTYINITKYVKRTANNIFIKPEDMKNYSVFKVGVFGQ